MVSRDLRTIAAIVLASFLILCLPASSTVTKEPDSEEILSKFYSLQIPFIENQGQIKDTGVTYYAKTLGAGFFITRDGQIAYALSKNDDKFKAKGWTIKESLTGAFIFGVSGEERNTINVNEFKGKDPIAWKADIPAYNSVNLGEVYSGIELKVKAYGGGIKKVFSVKPKAAIEGIRIKVEGAKGLTINEQGELEVETGLGVIKFSKPLAYQEHNGAWKCIDAAYVLNGNEYSFTVGDYDRTKELLIAPMLVSSFAGDTTDEVSPAIAIDGSGNVYIAGATASPDFPTTVGAYDSSQSDSTDVFVAKLNSDQSEMLATAILGGSKWEEAYALAIDSNGDVYVAGGTTSPDFPTTPGAYNTTYRGGEDAFISKFDPNLQTLLSSSYFGDAGDDRVISISIDPSGNVSITGMTTSRELAALYGASGTSPSDSPVSFSAMFDNNLNPYLSGQTDTKGQPTSSQPSVDSSSTTAKSALDTPKDQTQTQKDTGKDKPNEPVGEGWFSGTGEEISPEKAKAYYETKKKEKITQIGVPTFGILAAESPSSETLELARALRYDPKLIYDYVHNHIDYVPYFGSLKGATLTYFDGSGNDFDQASLMISLLRSSGYTAQYVYGTMTIPGSQLANWLGVDQNSTVIGTVISSGGIPRDPPLSDGTTTMKRVWVKATIGGVDYLFDPAFKSYTYKNKINIGQAMGYSQSELMTAATTGATIGSDYVQNLNETNLRNKLATYASNLVTTIRSQYPNSDVSEIIGGRSIVQTNLTQYQTSLPFSPVVTATWPDTIPPEYTTKLRIQHVGIDYTFNTPDLSGKRVTLTYAGGDNHPELSQDGTLIASGNATTLGTKYNLTITIDHPYAAAGPSGIPGTYCDQTVTTYTPESGRSYAIVYNFGGVSDTLLQKRQQQLETYRAQGLPDTSEAVLGETLNIMGQTWLKECQMVNRLLSALAEAETVSITHHMVGVMAQEAGYYIDVKAAMSSIISKHNINADGRAHFKAYSLIGSAFEHGMLEQLMGSDKPGVSTIKLFQRANETARKVFYANSSNYCPEFPNTCSPSSVQAQLVNYSAADKNYFQSQVSNGYTLILPDNGQLQLAVGQWKGKGYISKKIAETSWEMEMAIGGGYNGGYVAYNNVYVEPVVVSQAAEIALKNDPTPETRYLQAWKPIRDSLSIEPVVMASGAYIHDRTDLQLGSEAPLGLSLHPLVQ